jgi:hypothetical protein
MLAAEDDGVRSGTGWGQWHPARAEFEEEAAKTHPLYRNYQRAKAAGGDLYAIWRLAVLKSRLERNAMVSKNR